MKKAHRKHHVASNPMTLLGQLLSGFTTIPTTPKNEPEPSDKSAQGDAPNITRLFPKFNWTSCWSSPEKFTQHIESMDPKKAWDDAGWDKSENFYGTPDMETAIKMAKEGWIEGVNKLEKMYQRVLAYHPIQKKAVRYGVVGAVPCVPRAVAGDPLNMKQIDDARSRRRPVITLISNMRATANVDADSISNRAAVVAALIDHIESAGFSCEIISISPVSGGSKYKGVTAITVKESTQAVDIVRLAFSLGHASFVRRFIFADRGYAKFNNGKLGWGMGSRYSLTEEEIKELNEQGYFVIPSAEENEAVFKDEELSAKEGLTWLINSLKKQSCPAFKPWTEADQKLEDAEKK